ncbi:class I SAM-dependent methyltransferase [Kribbella sindirgiensis]|uniref:Class I SAM-dependent methyltransferase n=1 Tax=Kribbella sindirgiensis TaxID=1124744 RepID=A0A4R0I0J9_9ACTN|nr:class I SAM-dependent methyltransferase [Kribbella sindirgiensis]TCC20608.1 class I SAM-dependent methyltransferase [Kribbella sindirgiensis]
MTQLDPVIRSYYRDRYVEDDRLVVHGHGRLELLRTQELLRRWLPPASVVLDVGGATGVHARWLAADGHRVTLIDPVPEHVQQAATIGTFAAEEGDARELRQADASVDVTLLLGPLYHLVDAADRARALAEAVRVTRPGGVVAAAGINRYGGLLEAGSNGTLTEENLHLFLDAFASGSIDGSSGFTVAYFHHAAELATELTTAGLTGVEVLGIEGPASNILENAAPDRIETLLPAAVLLARQVESDPNLRAASPHFLAHGRVVG